MSEQAVSKWQCKICKFEVEGKSAPDKCPICGAAADMFDPVDAPQPEAAPSLDSYLSEWTRTLHEDEEKFSLIQKLAKTGRSEISPMGTRKPFPGLDTILFRGAQFERIPLDEEDEVSTKTVIGPNAKHPLEMDIPFYVSHMSFGALSKEAKIALAMGSAEVGCAACSGEGGMLPEEREHAKKYIYEIGTAGFGYDEEAIKQADGVEIKFGQAAKPGMGGHLPADKITEEIAKIRKIKMGEDYISPNRQPGVDTPEDLKNMVDKLRELTDGRPIGVKFTAGRIEKDLEFVCAANPDFITIDCRGGATGAAPTYIRDHVCLPPIYAIRRTRKFLEDKNSSITFCAAGGFRDSTDIAKAIALGADAVALATTSLIAIGCQQYRICNTGGCPVGIATQDEELRSRFSIPASKQRFVNFFQTSADEIKSLMRINGRKKVHDLDLSDIFTISNRVSQNTDIEFA